MTARDVSADASGGTQACKAMGFSGTVAETRFRVRCTVGIEKQEKKEKISRGERAGLDVCRVTCVFDTTSIWLSRKRVWNV
jgi:3-methyladenine DNA glycosylase Mpg